MRRIIGGRTKAAWRAPHARHAAHAIAIAIALVATAVAAATSAFAAQPSLPPSLQGDAPARPIETLIALDQDDPASLHEALRRQCALPRVPEPWPALCPSLPAAELLREWIAARFDAWPLQDANGATGLLTGYYEPVVTGSRTRESALQAPLYRRPPDMVAGPDGTRLRLENGRPAGAYPDRAAIETRALLAGNELLWIDDSVEAFFLHIQGSGRVRLRDGSEVRVGFADHNGLPYRAIGRELIDRGAMAAKDVDAQAIKDWLRTNPAEARSVMHTNRRYVFFRELPDIDSPSTSVPADRVAAAARPGPPGSLGVALTPMRSVATDPAFVPTGALMFIDSTHPDDAARLRRLVVSQDRGAAITGAVRADLYWGTGDEAGRLAGATRQTARMWLLWPRGTTPPRR